MFGFFLLKSHYLYFSEKTLNTYFWTVLQTDHIIEWESILKQRDLKFVEWKEARREIKEKFLGKFYSTHFDKGLCVCTADNECCWPRSWGTFSSSESLPIKEMIYGVKNNNKKYRLWEETKYLQCIFWILHSNYLLQSRYAKLIVSWRHFVLSHSITQFPAQCSASPTESLIAQGVDSLIQK